MVLALNILDIFSQKNDFKKANCHISITNKLITAYCGKNLDFNHYAYFVPYDLAVSVEVGIGKCSKIRYRSRKTKKIPH